MTVGRVARPSSPVRNKSTLSPMVIRLCDAGSGQDRKTSGRHSVLVTIFWTQHSVSALNIILFFVFWFKCNLFLTNRTSVTNGLRHFSTTLYITDNKMWIFRQWVYVPIFCMELDTKGEWWQVWVYFWIILKNIGRLPVMVVWNPAVFTQQESDVGWISWNTALTYSITFTVEIL
jgi:hypothetical protein